MLLRPIVNILYYLDKARTKISSLSMGHVVSSLFCRICDN